MIAQDVSPGSGRKVNLSSFTGALDERRFCALAGWLRDGTNIHADSSEVPNSGQMNQVFTNAREPIRLFLCGLIVAALLISTASLTLARNPQSSQSAQAKKDYALIYGTVWGPDDHPAAGVPIKIRRQSDKKAKWDLFSDSNGEFAQRVPVGAQDYVIEAEVKTHKGEPKPQTIAHVQDNERVDVSLHLTRDMLRSR